MALQTSLPQDAPSTTAKPSKALIIEHATNEIVFAVVGHVGSGTSTIATTLRGLLENPALPGGKYEVGILKARGIIEDWANRNGEASLPIVLADIMGLTKVNFNACLFADGLPVTLRFADAVGEILTAAPISEGAPFPPVPSDDF